MFFLIIVASFFLGALCGVAVFKNTEVRVDGRFISSKDEDGNYIWKLDLDFDPKELPQRKYVTFKVYNINKDNIVLKSQPIMQKNKKGDKKNER